MKNDGLSWQRQAKPKGKGSLKVCLPAGREKLRLERFKSHALLSQAKPEPCLIILPSQRTGWTEALHWSTCLQYGICPSVLYLPLPQFPPNSPDSHRTRAKLLGVKALRYLATTQRQALFPEYIHVFSTLAKQEMSSLHTMICHHPAFACFKSHFLPLPGPYPSFETSLQLYLHE